MPKVVPSQVVEYIENTFPIVTDEARYTKIDVTTARISALRTVIELTESIPSELIAVDGPDFIDFTSGVMALKGTISQWESRGERRGNLPFVEGRGQKTGLDLVREVLQNAQIPPLLQRPGALNSLMTLCYALVLDSIGVRLTGPWPRENGNQRL